MDDEEITLEIEGNTINCKKKILMDNSDYFKVMFQGNFVERNKSVIQLQGVDFKSVNIILCHLSNDNYMIEEEDLLVVLQTACMLQFSNVRAICIDRLNEVLSVKNCLKIWCTAESLDIEFLYLKAKNLSLMEFSTIKDTDCLLELTFKELYKYLANIHLHTQNEFDVFTTCMKWWYENSVKDSSSSTETTKMFYNFLYCIDFHSLSDAYIREMMIYPDFSSYNEIIETLNDVIAIRESNLVESVENSKANILLNSKKRLKNIYPSILLDSGHICENCKHLFVQVEDTISAKKCWTANLKRILLYDSNGSNFIKLVSIPQEKLDNLEGFHILGYKELIFLFGGEFFWGRGNWCENFWVYDTIRERWERKTKIPFGRRHFEACIANDIIYIVGGTGSFRVLQDNMFWYSYKTDKWSSIINLPCSGRQIKCCEYKNELFILNMNNKRGYIYNMEMNTWIQLKICDNNKEVPNFSEKFVVFSYKDFIYIKGSSIIKLKINENRLEVLDIKKLETLNFDTMESVLCNDTLFTIYKNVGESHAVVFEEFNVTTYTVDKTTKYDDESTAAVTVCGEICMFNKSSRLFTLSHYKIIEKNIYLRDVSI